MYSLLADLVGVVVRTDVRLNLHCSSCRMPSPSESGEGLEIMTPLAHLSSVVRLSQEGLNLSLLKKLFLHDECAFSWIQEEIWTARLGIRLGSRQKVAGFGNEINDGGSRGCAVTYAAYWPNSYTCTAKTALFIHLIEREH